MIISCSNSSGTDNTYQYHTVEDLDIFLDEIKLNYPGITSLETVGYSELNRPIKAIVISDNPGTLEGEPAIRLTAGVHGNEKAGIELLIRFIEYLTSNYETDAGVKEIVSSRYICIIPVLNPDGLAANSRNNSRGVDLNRNFDEHWESGSSHGASAFSESESRALRDFSISKNFDISVTYHTGAVLVNLPFDYGRESDGVYPVENDLVKSYAKTYTNAGTFLSNPDLYKSTDMMEGIINGGNWYIITGSLGDWSYTKTACLDLTVEVADYSPDSESAVQQIFMYNRDSLMAYIARAGYGIQGQITGSDGKPLIDVEITVSSAGITGDLKIKSDSNGYYNRILLPGTYSVTFTRSDLATKTINDVVVTDKTQLNIQF